MNISLHIVEASNLSLIGMMKSIPDPYCKVIIGNRRQKTGFLKKTTNPRWDHRFNFENVSPQSPVHIEIRDHNRLKKDRMIGVLETDVQKLLNNPISWWPLVGRDGSGGTLYIDAKSMNFQNMPMGQQQMTQGIQQGSYVPQGQGNLTGQNQQQEHHGLGSFLPHPTHQQHQQGLGTTMPQQSGSSFPQQGMGSNMPQQSGSSFPQQSMGSNVPLQSGSSVPQQGMGTTVPQQGTTEGQTHIHIHRN